MPYSSAFEQNCHDQERRWRSKAPDAPGTRYGLRETIVGRLRQALCHVGADVNQPPRRTTDRGETWRLGNNGTVVFRRSCVSADDDAVIHDPVAGIQLPKTGTVETSEWQSQARDTAASIGKVLKREPALMRLGNLPAE